MYDMAALCVVNGIYIFGYSRVSSDSRQITKSLYPASLISIRMSRLDRQIVDISDTMFKHYPGSARDNRLQYIA